MEQDPEPEAEPKKRGRPPGSKNKPKLGDAIQPIQVPPSAKAMDDYRYADPSTLVARNFALIDWTQQALRNEMRRGMQAKGEHIDAADVKKLVEVSNALSRTVEALKRTSDLAEELSKRMTPADLLEAALKKIEGQDLPTINYAIKRLRACRERLAPVTHKDARQMGETVARATDAIASLELDDL